MQKKLKIYRFYLRLYSIFLKSQHDDFIGIFGDESIAKTFGQSISQIMDQGKVGIAVRNEICEMMHRVCLYRKETN